MKFLPSAFRKKELSEHGQVHPDSAHLHSPLVQPGEQQEVEKRTEAAEKATREAAQIRDRIAARHNDFLALCERLDNAVTDFRFANGTLNHLEERLKDGLAQLRLNGPQSWQACIDLAAFRTAVEIARDQLPAERQHYDAALAEGRAWVEKHKISRELWPPVLLEPLIK